jgi:integrase
MMFFLLTGVRLEELTYLPWTHVDLKAKTFKIGAWDSDKIKDWPKGWRVIKWSSKNSQTRKNPLDQRLIPILKRRFKRKDSPLVFAGRGGGRAAGRAARSAWESCSPGSSGAPMWRE